MRTKKFLVLVVWAFSIKVAQADIKPETVCYGNQPKGHLVEFYGLLLHTYYDKNLRREVGAFVQYNKMSSIPVAFEKINKTDQNDPELGNFELRRTEIINGQVTGVYSLIQDGARVRQGKYREYRNKKQMDHLYF